MHSHRWQNNTFCYCWREESVLRCYHSSSSGWYSSWDSLENFQNITQNWDFSLKLVQIGEYFLSKSSQFSSDQIFCQYSANTGTFSNLWEIIDHWDPPVDWRTVLEEGRTLSDAFSPLVTITSLIVNHWRATCFYESCCWWYCCCCWRCWCVFTRTWGAELMRWWTWSVLDTYSGPGWCRGLGHGRSSSVATKWLPPLPSVASGRVKTKDALIRDSCSTHGDNDDDDAMGGLETEEEVTKQDGWLS